VHRFVEAQKLAHADAYRYVADPAFVDSPLEALLSDTYAEVQRRRIDATRAAAGRVRYGDPETWTQDPEAARFREPLPALPPRPPRTPGGAPQSGSTSHLIVADGDGNCFTFTHTLGSIFGGHDVLGTTGVLGSNSMDWFDLDSNVWTEEPSRLVLEPGKRNRFTLSPGMVFRNGRPVFLVGGSAAETTMPGIAQVLLNMLEFGLDPQSAIEAPRVVFGDILHWTGGSRLHVDPEIRAAIGDSLQQMGHVLADEPGGRRPIVGMVNAVAIDPETGHFAGGAEIRADGHVAGF
jgi:gamma-glutamyltranspeptidase/glutathione hydrolase